ncbi:MAG: N-acetylmuramoyl-L-alanine amidase LytC [Chlamydiia bacterium]|nr:N-acetylmuramoyl-L-alanine amidase LytC [Chlamydiia bacterium]MCH9615037.1 N-acetylmuramoyl-L-alanine amidase LytC [Chlamydiia bacterium]MCH9629912.1 N-acetylmuramoyl-L-alanine amidase LytC [Chlamydiia bacterium]
MKKLTLFLLLTLSLFGAPVKKAPGPLIVLDAGHGGYDVGSASHKTYEKDLCLSTTMLTKKYLTQKGYRVVLTRTRDVFIPLKKRAAIANKTRARLFVSLHFNAAKTDKAAGIEVFYYNKGNKWRQNCSSKLAKRVLANLLWTTKAPSRGVKVGNFHVIRETSMPAILVEGGFITNTKERNKLKDARYRDKIARAVAAGIHSYFTKK